MKRPRKLGAVFLAMMLLAVSGPVLARSSGIDVVQPKEVVSGDRFAAGQIITNEGTIKGDLIFGGHNVSSTGTVEGDVIGVGRDVSLQGSVLGNVRVGAPTISLAGQVGKNVTLFGGAVSLAQSSVVNGSATVFGGSITLGGKIGGRTLVRGRNVVLGGEFFGDVDVNDFATRGGRFHGFGMNRFRFHGRDRNARLTVLPGTIVHGVLTFRGSDADIEKGARVADFQWIKPSVEPPVTGRPGIYWYAWKCVRLIFTTAAYFLMGLLLLDLFPAFFAKAAAFAAGKPWNAIGHGVIGLFSAIVVAVACVILLVLSFIMTPMFGIMSGIAAAAFYALLFFVARVPAASWLGGLILREGTAAHRFGVGIVVLTVGLFVLAMLGEAPVVGPFFHVLAFVGRFGFALLGAGALLRALWESCVTPKEEDDHETTV